MPPRTALFDKYLPLSEPHALRPLRGRGAKEMGDPMGSPLRRLGMEKRMILWYN